MSEGSRDRHHQDSDEQSLGQDSVDLGMGVEGCEEGWVERQGRIQT